MRGLALCSLRNLIHDGAARHGDRVAAQQGARQMSYAELLERARGFGAHLRDGGFQAGQFAALAVENSLEYVAALCGIFEAGGVAVPINPDAAGTELGKVLADCRPAVLITRERFLARAGQPSIDAKIIFAESAMEARTDCESAAGDSDPSAPAMVLYTSGTTGRPKGVVLTHGNLMANTHSIVEYMKLTREDSIVNVLPFFHSFGNSVLLTHLAVGGKVIVENRFAFPGQVVEAMQSLRPTGFSGVPTTFYILIHKTNFLERDWSFLRYVSQAGGAMRQETTAQLRRALPNTSVYVMYGQTEASARLSYVPPEMLEKKPGSIGIAIPGCELRVVDQAGNAVQGDEVGEIVARGSNIMHGYLNDPDSTSQALRGGWLRTGDMARMDEDGYLYVAGRKSEFIKSAGYRIGPAEVEEVIAESASEVEDVAVFGVPDEVLGEAVAACICCPPEKFDAAAIRNICMAKLPLWKVPKHVLHTARIPRTASGKKQYFALRETYRGLGCA